MTTDRPAHPKGAGLKIGMTGKFLPFKYYGAKVSEHAQEYKEQ